MNRTAVRKPAVEGRPVVRNVVQRSAAAVVAPSPARSLQDRVGNRAVQSVVAPSMKVTVPSPTPGSANTDVTVVLSVIIWPNALGLTSLLAVAVCVAAALTTWLSVAAGGYWARSQAAKSAPPVKISALRPRKPPPTSPSKSASSMTANEPTTSSTMRMNMASGSACASESDIAVSDP